jgi:hypothetical protein
MGREEESADAYRLALEALSAESGEDRAGFTMAMLTAQAGLWVFGFYAQAGFRAFFQTVLDEQLDTCMRTGNHRGAAKILFEYGLMAHQDSRFEKASFYYGQALSALGRSGDESLPPDGPVEQTNWAPFLRLMIVLCKGGSDSPEAVGDDLMRLLQSRPKGLNLKHAFELLLGLASTLASLESDPPHPAEDHVQLAAFMLGMLAGKQMIEPSELDRLGYEINMVLGALIARDPAREGEAAIQYYKALYWALRDVWRGSLPAGSPHSRQLDRVLEGFRQLPFEEPADLRRIEMMAFLALAMVSMRVPELHHPSHE